MTVIPGLSAFHRAGTTDAGVSRSNEKTAIKAWEVEGGNHPAFDAASGVYTVQRDGLYAVCVQILPSDGRAHVSREVLSVSRTAVDYVLRITEGSSRGHVEDEDSVEDEYLDVGDRSFGEVLHLRAESEMSLWAMPTALARRDSLRLKVDILIRKRKRSPEPELNSRELKKLEKKRKRAHRLARTNGNDGIDGMNDERERTAMKSKTEDIEEIESEVDTRKLVSGSVGSCTSDLEFEAVVGGSCDDDRNENDNNGDDEEDENDDAWSAEFSSDESAVEGDDDKGGVGRIAKKLRSAGTSDG